MKEENKNFEENIQPVNQASVEETLRDEKTTKNKKTNKPLLAILLIIFLGFIFGCGLYLGKQLFEDKKECPETEKNNTETKEPIAEPTSGEKITIDVNDFTVNKLMDIFGYNCNILGEKINTDNKTRLGIASANVEAKHVLTTKCITHGAKGALYDDENLPAYCGLSMTDEMSKYYSNDKEAFEKAGLMNDTNVIYEEYLRSKYVELFSSSYEYKAERFGGCSFMEYNSNLKNYARYTMECGGTCGEEKQTVTSAYKLGDKLYIETDFENSDGKMKVNYEFILENGIYKFLKVTEVK